MQDADSPVVKADPRSRDQGIQHMSQDADYRGGHGQCRSTFVDVGFSIFSSISVSILMSFMGGVPGPGMGHTYAPSIF